MTQFCFSRQFFFFHRISHLSNTRIQIDAIIDGDIDSNLLIFLFCLCYKLRISCCICRWWVQTTERETHPLEQTDSKRDQYEDSSFLSWWMCVPLSSDISLTNGNWQIIRLETMNSSKTEPKSCTYIHMYIHPIYSLTRSYQRQQGFSHFTKTLQFNYEVYWMRVFGSVYVLLMRWWALQVCLLKLSLVTYVQRYSIYRLLLWRKGGIQSSGGAGISKKARFNVIFTSNEWWPRTSSTPHNLFFRLVSLPFNQPRSCGAFRPVSIHHWNKLLDLYQSHSTLSFYFCPITFSFSAPLLRHHSFPNHIYAS